MPIKSNTIGLAFSKSTVNFHDTYTQVISILEANEKIKIIKELDHQANAAKVGLDIGSTKLVIFGNPLLGTPLMLKNQLTALDLPQKILVFEENNEVFVCYNDTIFSGARHSINEVPTLEKIAGALKNITSKATNDSVSQNDLSGIQKGTGILSIASNHSFESTYNKLKSIIEGNENLKLIADLDHSANAAKVDLSLRPTRLLLFGNPKMGTPLMQSSRTVAIDLPQKMLIWEDEKGMTNISYNDPNFLKERHGLSAVDEVLQKISGALATISSKAAE